MLKNITLTNFGIHKKLNLAFQAGLNVIIGANRSGKTQTLESICFGYFGKTSNSKLEKIINFNAEKTDVYLSCDGFDLTRTRTKTTSSLSGIDKLELDAKLNLAYQEFLSIFYISSQEQKSLFDSAYLRQFLLTLFDLDKYAKIYQRLKLEYTNLKSLDKEIKVWNQVWLKQKYARIKMLLDKLEAWGKTLTNTQKTLQNSLNLIYLKQGEITNKKNILLKNLNLIKQGKCFTCTRPFSDDFIKTETEKCTLQLNNLNKIITQINDKKDLFQQKEKRLDSLFTAYNEKVYRCKKLITILQERAKQQKPTLNLSRIKELETLMPIFDSKGFPSHLLQIYLPTIIQTTNQLLNCIFPDMCVDIRTEKAESNRPDFKPFIIRDKETLELKDLSGSERVLVNLCFRLGIITIFKRLCNTGVDFMLIDEGLERVDNDNCMKLLQLFENFLNLGYLKQIIVVTHKDILKDQERVHYIRLTEGV